MDFASHHTRLLVLAALGLLGFEIFVFMVPAALHTEAQVTSEPPKPHAEVRLLFVGDMFFDRHVRDVIEGNGEDAVFACMDSTLNHYDAVVGNLEGPVTDNASISRGSKSGSPQNFTFTFATSTGEMLLRHNIKIVSLGNNHILNFGHDGLVSTHKYLTDAGVDFFGGVKGNDPVLQTSVNGVPLSFVAYNEFGGDSADETARKIAQEHEAGRTVFVFAHWGDEYSRANSHQKTLALLFASAGADAVIGAHPHVVQEHEMLGGVPVFYSLGNLVFDQYWNYDVSHGRAVELVASEKGITVGAMYESSTAFSGKTCLKTLEY